MAKTFALNALNINLERALSSFDAAHGLVAPQAPDLFSSFSSKAGAARIPVRFGVEFGLHAE